MKTLELFAGSKSVLCIVAETTGSCPGKTGFKMTVSSDGTLLGSVGGGTLEFKVIAAAREMLQQSVSETALVSYSHNQLAEPGEKSGMICSGSQKILLIPSPPMNHMMDSTRGIRVTAEGLEFTGYHNREGLTGDECWIYTENLQLPWPVFVFGGGHCSLALTPVLNSLNMRTIIIDDRDYVHTMKANDQAWKKIHMSYLDAGKLVPDNGRAIVIIMPASHQGDAVILRQMLTKNLKYLGMMASRTTTHHIFSMMRAEGFTEEQLARVHSPIGISIGSHSPCEIAVSIAAEIISVCNRKS